MPSASFFKSGTARCYSCNRIVSKGRICFKCVLAGEESRRLVLPASILANIGQLLIYECLACGRPTHCVQSEPGLTPYIMGCRALGEGACAGGAYRKEAIPKVDRRRDPSPKWEFFRPVGIDYRNLEPGLRSLVDDGILDLREIRGSLVRLAS